MKRIRTAVLASVILALAASVAGAHPTTPRIDRREARQHARIQQGWRAGQITRAERLRLRAGQRHIHRMEWRAKRDGHVNRWERRRIARAQNHEHRVIRRLRHNGRVLYGGGRSAAALESS